MAEHLQAVSIDNDDQKWLQRELLSKHIIMLRHDKTRLFQLGDVAREARLHLLVQNEIERLQQYLHKIEEDLDKDDHPFSNNHNHIMPATKITMQPIATTTITTPLPPTATQTPTPLLGISTPTTLPAPTSTKLLKLQVEQTQTLPPTTAPVITTDTEKLKTVITVPLVATKDAPTQLTTLAPTDAIVTQSIAEIPKQAIAVEAARTQTKSVAPQAQTRNAAETPQATTRMVETEAKPPVAKAPVAASPVAKPPVAAPPVAAPPVAAPTEAAPPEAVETVAAETVAAPADAGAVGIMTSTIPEYTWDQCKTMVKVYVNIPCLRRVGTPLVDWYFQDRHVSLDVLQVRGKNYHLSIQNLEGKIIPQRSHWRIDDELIVLHLQKCVYGLEWKQLTVMKEGKHFGKALSPGLRTHTHASSNGNLAGSSNAEDKRESSQNVTAKWSSIAENKLNAPKLNNMQDSRIGNKLKDGWNSIIGDKSMSGLKFGKPQLFSSLHKAVETPNLGLLDKAKPKNVDTDVVAKDKRKNVQEQVDIQNEEVTTWIIEDAETASVALTNMVSASPRKVKVAFPPTQSVSMKLVTAVAGTPCDLTLMLKDSFQHPTKQNFIRDGAFLHSLVTNSRCRLVTFYGHLSDNDVVKLPACTSRLGLSIGCVADLSALAKLAHLTDLNTLTLMIDTSVDAKKLLPIPVIEVKKLFLCFNNVTNGNINDVASALKLLQQRVRAVVFTNSSVTEKGVLLFGHELKANPPVTATVVIHSSSVTATSVPKLVAQYLLLGLTLLIEAN